jgi:hypothetical protein
MAAGRASGVEHAAPSPVYPDRARSAGLAGSAGAVDRRQDGGRRRG